MILLTKIDQKVQKWAKKFYFIHFYFQKIERSSKTMLDRWSIAITNEDDYSKGSKDNLNEENRKMVSEKIPFNIINNYFSIGVVSC